MRKIHKIANIALIFMLIGVAVSQNAYCLRVPIEINDREEETLKALKADKIKYKGKRVLLGFIRHKFGNYLSSFNSNFSLLPELLETFNEESLVNLCKDTGGQWNDWYKDLSKLYKNLKQGEIIHFEIQDILEQIKGNIALTKGVSIKLKKEFKKEKFEPKRQELMEKVKRLDTSLKKAANIIKVVSFISKVSKDRDVNEIISYYRKNIEDHFKIKLSKETLIFDETLEDGSIIILGIIDNFVINGWRASGWEYQVTIKTVKEGNWIKIEASDIGNGIHKNRLSRIFDEGFTSKELEEGEIAGQGLYLTLEYLKLIGGKIQVDTKTRTGKAWRLTFDDKLEKSRIRESDRATKGTTFTMWLPLAPGETTGWDSAWGEPTKEAVEIADRYMKEWDSHKAIELSTSQQFERTIWEDRHYVLSQRTVDIFKAISKKNIDWAASILISGRKGSEHHTGDYVLLVDWDKPYFSEVLNRAMELLRDQLSIKCITRTFNIYYNDRSFLDTFYNKLEPKEQEFIYDNLKDRNLAYLIDCFYFWHKHERTLWFASSDVAKNYYRNILNQRQEAINFLTPGTLDWLGLSEIKIPPKERLTEI